MDDAMTVRWNVQTFQPHLRREGIMKKNHKILYQMLGIDSKLYL